LCKFSTNLTIRVYDQHFNSNRVIIVDVKEKFQGAHILSRDERFDCVIV